jgi:hypothetical protein
MFHLVTVATDDQGYWKQFLESCGRHGIAPEVLGWGEKWQGFTWKVDLVRKHIQTLNDDDIVFIVDAYDVLVLEDIHEIVRRFKQFNKPIVFASENEDDFGMYSFFFGYCFRNDNHKINGGMISGYAWALKRLFQAARDTHSETTDDQVLWNTTCSANEDFFSQNVSFDTENRLMYIPPLLDLENLYECSLDTKGTCFFHCTGNRDMRETLSANGYSSVSTRRAASLIDRGWYYIRLSMQTRRNVWCTGGVIVFLLVLVIVLLPHLRKP